MFQLARQCRSRMKGAGSLFSKGKWRRQARRQSEAQRSRAPGTGPPTRGSRACGCSPKDPGVSLHSRLARSSCHSEIRAARRMWGRLSRPAGRCPPPWLPPAAHHCWCCFSPWPQAVCTQLRTTLSLRGARNQPDKERGMNGVWRLLWRGLSVKCHSICYTEGLEEQLPAAIPALPPGRQPQGPSWGRRTPETGSLHGNPVGASLLIGTPLPRGLSLRVNGLPGPRTRHMPRKASCVQAS